ncbi:MAG: GMP synthase subunit A [Thermoplasmatota archaeon]
MRILVVDNGGQWTHREYRVLKYLGVETEIVDRETPWEKLADVDGLVLSGGAPTGVTLDTMGANPAYLANVARPILGVCAGAQVMGLQYGGALAPARAPEYGKARVSLAAGSDGGRILAGLPRTFVAWENHNDEVSVAPKGFRVLAASENCRMQAMENAALDRYAVQFHPEVEHTEHGERIFRNFIDICKR